MKYILNHVLKRFKSSIGTGIRLVIAYLDKLTGSVKGLQIHFIHGSSANHKRPAKTLSEAEGAI